jgi:starch synthase (maltosyl-transferring)
VTAPAGGAPGDAGSGLPPDLPGRVVIEGVTPEIDCGRYPAKRVVGDEMTVEARIVADGHDRLAAVLLHRRRDDAAWQEVPLAPRPDDRWTAAFPIRELGAHEYTVEAWVDEFATWQAGLAKKVAAAQEVGSELLAGAALLAGAPPRRSTPSWRSACGGTRTAAARRAIAACSR